jgi:hypothetical protein
VHRLVLYVATIDFEIIRYLKKIFSGNRVQYC